MLINQSIFELSVDCSKFKICSAQSAGQGLALHLIWLYAIPTTQSQLKPFHFTLAKTMTTTKTKKTTTQSQLKWQSLQTLPYWLH